MLTRGACSYHSEVKLELTRVTGALFRDDAIPHPLRCSLSHSRRRFKAICFVFPAFLLCCIEALPRQNFWGLAKRPLWGAPCVGGEGWHEH